MKNRKKYKDELIKIVKNGDLCDLEDFFDKHVKPYFNTVNGEYFKDVQLIALIMLWLDEEYKVPEVDWSKVEVDTPILVRNGDDEDWNRAHFSDYECGKVYTWDGGGTSWTSDNEMYWMQAKLAEPWEGENDEK